MQVNLPARSYGERQSILGRLEQPQLEAEVSLILAVS